MQGACLDFKDASHIKEKKGQIEGQCKAVVVQVEDGGVRATRRHEGEGRG